MTETPPREYELSLNEEEAALLHYAVWLAFGRERRSRSLWTKLRDALGDRYQVVADASQRIQ